MKKNYYEILEIDKNASPEIVDKAYRTLAKKYHPDLQQGDKKKQCEEKLKIINEAYSVLSDPEKRKVYDAKIPDNNISVEEYENMRRQKEYMKEQISRMKQQQMYQRPYPPNYAGQRGNYNAYDEEMARRIAHQQELENARSKAYYDAYIQSLKNQGYRIKYKKTWKDYLTVIIAIVIMIFICFILWHIPPIQEYLIELYNSNQIIKFFVDIVSNVFNALFKSEKAL